MQGRRAFNLGDHRYTVIAIIGDDFESGPGTGVQLKRLLSRPFNHEAAPRDLRIEAMLGAAGWIAVDKPRELV